MAMIDSEAVFRVRCDAIDDTQVLRARLRAHQLTTFSKLGYALGPPNQAPSDQEYQAFAATIFGANATLGESSDLRRIHFEATTYCISALKSAIAGDQADSIRKLPVAEKVERIEALRGRLPGVLIQGETEPSHSLIDKCQIMYDTGSVLWLHPSTCTKRDIEIQAALKEPSQVLKIESQSLKVSTEAQAEAADHGTELKLQWCLTRRGLAMDLTNVLSWNVHQKWVQTMFSCYSSEAPSGFGKVSLQQLIRADKEMWTIMAREVSSLKPNAQGQKPLDVRVAQLQHDPRVTMHMLALPLRAAHPADDGGNASTPLRPKKKARPGKGNRPPPSPPDELKDCYQKTVQGKPICWGYNLSSGCSGKTTGQPPTCNKGAHICAWCRKIGHSFQTCRNAPSKQGN